MHRPESDGPSPSRGILGRRWLFETVYAVLVVAAAALILSVVGRRSGWPIGQAFYNQLILVQLYAAHFRHLDLFPVWSSSDGLGLGTPVLLYYQKAFFYVSGFIYILLGGSMKPTLVLTIAVFLVVGAYGMRRALGMVTDSRLLCVVGSLGFLFTNYVFTDWLVRGDLAEFSAMMIVPWLLFWCLNLVKNRRVSLLLIVIVPLLVDAHSAIGLISIFTLAMALATFLAVAGWRGLRRIGARLAVVVTGALVLLAPTLVAELRFSEYYDPASKVTHHDTVSQNFVTFWSYFYNGSYRWLSDSPHLDLQIDFAIWIPVVLALLGVVAVRLVTGRPGRADLARVMDLPSIAFLLLSGAIYMLLQLRIFLGVYRFLAPLEVIDFPNRMLCFIIPIGVVLVVVIGNVIIRAYPTSILPRLGIGAWLLSIVLLSPLTSTWTTHYELLAGRDQFPSAALSELPSHIDFRTYEGILSFNGILFLEYLPKVFAADGHELYSDGPLYARLHQVQDGAGSLTRTPCTVSVPTHAPLETLQLTFTVACRAATRLALPVTFNAYSSVFVAGAKGKLRRIPYFHLGSDPRMIIQVTGSSPEEVVVHLPTLWGVLS